MARDLKTRTQAAAHAVDLARRHRADRGPLRVVDRQLFAGGTRINDDESIVDSVYDATLFGCTIFLGDVRIATRATERGSDERALGTRANDAPAPAPRVG